MTRGRLGFLNFFLAMLMIAAAWWAVNAPRASRPSPTVLGAVDLPTERPPLPPAPYVRKARVSADGVGQRSIFAAERAPLALAPALRPEAPVAQGVVAPVAAAARRDLDEPPELKKPGDPFGFAAEISPPSHSQFFGGHMIGGEQRTADLSRSQASPASDVLASEEGGLAPEEAPKPLRRPESFDTAASASASPPAGAPRRDLSEITGSVDGLILLGVFRSRGADRALVRTPDGGNVRIEKGDEIVGWRVAAIGDAFVELRRSSQTRMLRMPGQ